MKMRKTGQKLPKAYSKFYNLLNLKIQIVFGIMYDKLAIHITKWTNFFGIFGVWKKLTIFIPQITQRVGPFEDLMVFKFITEIVKSDVF